LKNWKLIAKGLGLDIPQKDLKKIAPALDALEAAYRPLAADIPHPTEPAVIFHLPPEELS